MQLDEIQRRSREIFCLEAADLVRELETALLELEGDAASASALNRVFRVMHTLKGSGATSGFQELSDFLHRVEDVYNAARENRLQVTPAIIDLTLQIKDTVARYLAAAPADAPAVLVAAQGTLAALLTHLPAPLAKTKTATAAAPSLAETLHIVFRPNRDLFRCGIDPGMFLDDLRALGPCTITGSAPDLPPLAELDPESCHLQWEIDLTTAAGEAAVRQVFMFIEGECDLVITRPAAAPSAAAGTATWQVEFQATASMLATPGALDTLWRDLAQLGTHQVLQSPPAPDGKPAPGLWRLSLVTAAGADAIHDAFMLLMDSQVKVTREPAAAASAAAPSAVAIAAPEAVAGRNGTSATTKKVNETLRVSSERLDRLVNLVGELVILRSQVATACAGLPQVPPALQAASEALQSLSTEMRDVVLNIRMMPIEQTFSKFRRLVRDLSRELGKDIDLVIEGGETEMDKTVLDALADPLVHLVRNSLDHGLESAAERTAAGKPPRGKLRLRAEQRGDRVIVSVSDDGRGLNLEKIRAKALSRGLLEPGAQPTNHELHQLVFLAGFSTADVVSQVSGRGVGLDVVRRQVEQLRGKVELRSEPGRGAEFRLSLPLTLAIIEGLMVEVDGERFILPLSSARETIELTRAQRNAGNRRNVVELRGALVPYLNLRDVFGFTSKPPDLELVVIVELEDQRLGLVVDKVLGNHQTVLKSLGWVGQRVNVFSGTTVLGNGRVALILDLPALLAHARPRTDRGRGLEI